MAYPSIKGVYIKYNSYWFSIIGKNYTLTISELNALREYLLLVGCASLCVSQANV